MAQKISIGLIAGFASLILFLFAGTGSALAIIPTIFNPLPIFLAGLSVGTTAAIVGSGTVFFFLLVAGGLTSASLYLLAFGLPIVVLIRNALLNRPAEDGNSEDGVEWYPAGQLLLWLSGTACAVFVLLFIGTLGQDGGLSGQATRMFEDMLKNNEEAQLLLNELNPDVSVEEMTTLIGAAWPIMTCISIIAIMSINAGLAQRWLVRLGKAIRPSPSVLNMTLPEPLLLIFVLTAILSLFSGQLGYLGSGLSNILTVTYFLLGLTVVHAISSAWPGRNFGLTAFYLALFLLPLIAPIVALMGMAEPWLKLKQRFAAGGPDQPPSQGD